METFKGDVLYSKPGKASIYIYPALNLKPKRIPKPKITQPFLVVGIKDMLKEIESELSRDKEIRHNSKDQLTASFKSVSREKYLKIYRNKTESPEVGRYNPRYNFILPSKNQSPKLKHHTYKPKNESDFEILNKIVSLAESKGNNPDPNEEKQNPIGKSPKNDMKKSVRSVTNSQLRQSKMNSLVNFDKQLPRSPFIKKSDSPNEKRFDFSHQD